jgi:selenocysteine lyase/cysteine desulfurase
VLSSQKHLFQLPDDVHYLNCAYMSPLLKSVEEAGIRGLQRKRNPVALTPADFFSETEAVKSNFGRLVNGPAAQMAVIPSASYGLSTAMANVPGSPGRHAVTVADEFPSGVYALQDWCRRHGTDCRAVPPPDGRAGRGAAWNHRLLEAINADTAVVLISSVHWTDGTIFDLEAVGRRCKEVGAVFIVDGTQSVGAKPIDVQAAQIDALVVAAYKWMMGPYSIGMAYYSPYFNNGFPLENSWMTRANAHDFTSLTNYTDAYFPGAARYDMGEFSNFMLMPMLDAALSQLLEWEPARIQDYAGRLTAPLIDRLLDNGFGLEDPDWRAQHLFGFQLPPHLDKTALMQLLQSKKIYVSTRGSAIRVSAHAFNIQDDVEALMVALTK